MFVRLIREGRCGKSRRLSHLGSFYGADLFFVHNHLSTVHAIASCNAAPKVRATAPRTALHGTDTRSRRRDPWLGTRG
ncbi:MAG: hypothetical protein QOE74_6029 [Mycobacterium sp.]|jgi:hypothetical protein|nr:hypothetical protein [Mycobacterium sp.]